MKGNWVGKGNGERPRVEGWKAFLGGRQGGGPEKSEGVGGVRRPLLEGGLGMKGGEGGESGG